ncbi:protein DpdH [Sorangium sp. So ce134]
MSFAGYLCWKAEDVDDTVVYDAVMPSDAVFLATHTSAPIMRSEFQSTVAGTLCTEEDLLRHFIETPTDLLFAPIVGQSGRGKSHLVRWLRINIPENAARHVVYIPKYNTNLRGVIEEILRGLHGTRAEQLRAELARAADDVDENTAPEKLLYALALRIQKQTLRPSAVDGAAGILSKKEVQLRDYATQWLPELLRDHTFRSSLLAQKTGVLTRFAHETIRGRNKTDRDKPFAFEEDDLPRDVSEISQAGQKVREFYQLFVSNRALRQACVEFLNEHLGPAVAEVIGLRSGELHRILLDLRRLLLEQKKELVLLIEDFTVLQGVQDELLDAIIEAPVRNGERVLCSVRVAVAVTTGRFLDKFETVLTRAKFKGFLFSLDVPRVDEEAGGKGIHHREVLDFVGAYLNACRLGKPAIEDAYAAVGEGRRADGRWVENACEACEYRENCRGAFGRTSRGYGLYPFNEAALDRMIRARSGEEFDPREILGHVVRYTLSDHGEDIRAGRFPSAPYVEHFKSDRVSAASGALVAELKRDKEPRRLPLLVFWGGNPTKPVNLAEPIHEAFRLPPLADVEAQATPKRASDEDNRLRRSTRPPPPPPHQPSWVEAIDKWRDGTAQLDQKLARTLRNTIAEAVWQRIDWNEFCVPALVPRGVDFGAGSVRIEGAAGEGRAVPPIQLNLMRSSDTARAFQALLLFNEHGSWKFEGGAGYLRDLSREIDRWAAEVRAQYRTPADDAATRAIVGQMVEHALFGSRVLGLRGSHGDRTIDLVNAVFEKAPDMVFKKPSPPTWEALETSVALGPTNHEPTRGMLLDNLLFLVGRSQGDKGRPSAIDVTMLVDAIARMKRSWQLPEPDPTAPDWLKSLHARVAPHVEPAVAAEIQRLDGWSRTMRAHFPDGKALNDAVREAAVLVERADTVAREHGVRRPGDKEKMEELTALIRELQLPTSGFGAVTSLWKFLERIESASMGEKLVELSADRRRQTQMQQLERFVTLASAFLEQTSARVSTEHANVHAAQGQLGPTMEAIRDQIQEIVGALAAADGGAL